MPYPNEHSARLLNPDTTPHDRVNRTSGSGEGTVQGVKIPKSIDIIWFIEEKGDHDIVRAQALRFPLSKWTSGKAKDWLKKNDIDYISFETASNEKEKMIYCKELNSHFGTDKEMVKALVKYREDIIAIKKAQIFKSCEKGISISSRPLDISKILSDEAEKANFNTDDYYNIVVNSTYILDSHSDLHLKGIWNKTIKDQQGKNYLVADHTLGIDSTIARKEHIKMSLKEIPFSLIGKPYDGETQALIYTVRKDKIIHEKAREWLESGDSIEASVRMRYVDVDLAAKSDAKEDKKYRDNYEKWFPLIANKDDFENDITYFYGIKQAQNVMESSLVLYGSNPATGIINNQPSLDIGEQHKEPQKSTLDYDYLINNLKF